MNFSENYKSTWGYGLTVSYFFSKLPLIFLGRFIWFIHLFIVCVSIFIYTHISIQIDVPFVLTLTHPGPSMTFWKKQMDGTFPPTFPPKRQRGTVPPLS